MLWSSHVDGRQEAKRCGKLNGAPLPGESSRYHLLHQEGVGEKNEPLPSLPPPQFAWSGGSVQVAAGSRFQSGAETGQAEQFLRRLKGRGGSS